MSMSVSHLRGIGAVLVAIGLMMIVALVGAPATAAAAGYVRLAHLSPDNPPVDVYLRAQSGSMRERIFPGVAYGAVSAYLRLPTGRYAVAMRTAGAPRTDPPVLAAQLIVAAGAAYTVAGVGSYADLGLRVLRDDLSLPARGQAKVRVVQASARVPLLDVAVEGGAEIGAGVAFATATSYRQVPPGAWRLRVRPSTGGAASILSGTLEAGNVYSLLVLDAPGGGLRTRLIIDAARRGAVPSGGVATGAGGSLPDPEDAQPGADHAPSDQAIARQAAADRIPAAPTGPPAASSGRRAADWPVALLLAGSAAVLTGILTAALRRRPRQR